MLLLLDAFRFMGLLLLILYSLTELYAHVQLLIETSLPSPVLPNFVSSPRSLARKRCRIVGAAAQ